MSDYNDGNDYDRGAGDDPYGDELPDDVSEPEPAAEGEESTSVDVCAECGAIPHIDHTQLRRRSPRIVEVLECGHRIERY